MFARLGSWPGSTEEIERGILRAREHVKPGIRQDTGLKAAYWLVDRAGGKGLIVTFWESAEAIRASEEARRRRQTATSAATGAQVTTDRYEIIDSLEMLTTLTPYGPTSEPRSLWPTELWHDSG
ncbi:MAG: hypothetical protein ACREI6_00865 [Candidatus Rokuibacteriota bacterium]